LALLTGDWGAAWEAVKNLVSGAWEGIKKIFGGALDFIIGWGGAVLHNLIKPFEDAWNKISEFVNKIKGAMDPNKRNSPSMVDRLKTGVADLNDAWNGLQFNGTLNAQAAGVSVSNGGNMSSTIAVRVDMAGAMIADAYGANMMAELMGDQILKRLQGQLRI
jgi:phage-related protein